jgi:hypothetical protein
MVRDCALRFVDVERARSRAGPCNSTSLSMDLASMDDLNERQAASWMKQTTAIPGFGGKKR